MVALDPTRGSSALSAVAPANASKSRSAILGRSGVGGRIAAMALAIFGGFVIGICIATTGVVVVRDALLTLIVVALVVRTKHLARSAQDARPHRRIRGRGWWQRLHGTSRPPGRKYSTS